MNTQRTTHAADDMPTTRARSAHTHTTQYTQACSDTDHEYAIRALQSCKRMERPNGYTTTFNDCSGVPMTLSLASAARPHPMCWIVLCIRWLGPTFRCNAQRSSHIGEEGTTKVAVCNM